MKPRHSAEQSTVAVNKSASLGKTGFASAFAKVAPVVIPENPSVIPAKAGIQSNTQEPWIPNQVGNDNEKITEKIIDGKVYKVHGPSDPQDQYTCDSCQ